VVLLYQGFWPKRNKIKVIPPLKTRVPCA